MKKKLILILAMMGALLLGATASSFANETYNDIEYYLHYSPYRGVDKCIDTRYNGWLIMDGIDVSEYQHTIDWAAVKAAGIDYAIIRVGFRSYGLEGNMHEDEYFRTNMAGAKANGVMVGIYIFSQACSEEEAVAEADQAIAWLEAAGYNASDLDLPIVMDYEYAGANDGGRMYLSGLNAQNNQLTMTPYAKAFCDRVKEKGYTAGFYGNFDMYQRHVNFNEIGSNVFPWYAQYNRYAERANQCFYQMWQYNSDAYVSGISGRIDINFWFLEPNKIATTGKSIANCTVNVGTNGYFQYAGSAVAHKPAVTVLDGDKELTYGTDYGLGYFKNVSTGTAYAYVYGKGQYSDYKIQAFQIVTTMPAVDEELTAPEEGDITSTEYTIDTYIHGVEWGTTYQQFKEKVSAKSGYTYKVVNKQGEELDNKAVVGTGAKVNIYNNGELKASILVCIKGDGNGDGVLGANDAVILLRSIAGTYSINSVQKKAVDVNGNGTIEASDAVRILRHIAGTYTIAY